MHINENRTAYTDEEIIAAVEEATKRGEAAVVDNYGTDGELWERIAYSMTVAMADGGDVTVLWRPTEDGYKMAEDKDDDSYMCDWDEIALAM